VTETEYIHKRYDGHTSAGRLGYATRSPEAASDPAYYLVRNIAGGMKETGGTGIGLPV
jgi:hypothetical protein